MPPSSTLPRLIERENEPQPPGFKPMRVLLVDDEPIFRKIAHRVLTKLGYFVLAAIDGKAALEAASMHPDIQLLLTDVAMPGINGVELADKLRKTHPHLGVLYMSGFPKKSLSELGIEANSVDFLQKPFNSEELDDRIKAILARNN